MKALRAALRRRREQLRYRVRRIVERPRGPELTVDGESLLAFCSNDYLGLAGHPEVVQALQRGAERYGVGSTAAHLVVGHTGAHHRLEEALAEFVGRPRALLFSTGYMANLGAVAALTGRGDAVFEDRLNHASLLDAGRLAGARVVRYRHANADDLRSRLNAANRGAKLVATDGVFSMDGTLARLPQLAAAAAGADAWLMVDDAHGLGVLGPGGRGCLEHFRLGMDEVPVLMGTLGKALGTFGAFVAGDESLVEYLIQQARPYVYTTAPPAAVAEATLASLRLAKEEPWRRERLAALVKRFRAGAGQLGLPLTESTTPIQPLVVGSDRRALAWSEALQGEGLLVSAIRPPTVPEGSARLRITFSAGHSEEQVDRLLEALERAAKRVGVGPESGDEQPAGAP